MKADIIRYGERVDAKIYSTIASLLKRFGMNVINEEPLIVRGQKTKFRVSVVTSKTPLLHARVDVGLNIKPLPQTKVDIFWCAILLVVLATNDPISNEPTNHFAIALPRPLVQRQS